MHQTAGKPYAGLLVRTNASFFFFIACIIEYGPIDAGTVLPKGKAAIGWRVAVYWRDDKAFYPAEIMGYDTTTGRHEVEYDDGEPVYHTQCCKFCSSL